MESVRIIVDNEYNLPVQFIVRGTLEQGKDKRPMSIERWDADFTNPPGCTNHLRPYKSVMRIGGMLDDKQKAQMMEAQAQLAEAKQQLDSLPEDQKRMMMQMMGPQLEMMEKLAAGGGIEVVSNVVEARCGYEPTAEDIAQQLFQ